MNIGKYNYDMIISIIYIILVYYGTIYFFRHHENLPPKLNEIRQKMILPGGIKENVRNQNSVLWWYDEFGTSIIFFFNNKNFVSLHMSNILNTSRDFFLHVQSTEGHVNI